MAILRSITVSLATLSLVCSAACGEGGPAVSVDSPPSPASGVPLQGTERLAWDQAAPSYQRLGQYSFRIFVDGSAATLADVECLDSSSAGGFPCSTPVPPMASGTHTLHLAAVVDGAESARSSPLIVNMNHGRIVVSQETEPATVTHDRAATFDPGVLCLQTRGTCVSVHREVVRPVPLSSAAALPGRRLLFVEDGRQLRMLAAGVLSPEPAFTIHDRARIIGVLVDPLFEQTGLVRIAWIEERARSGRAFGITRARESQGRFGEAAVIVPPMPLPSRGKPQVAQDDRGRIYVAIPAESDATLSRSADAGRILRYSANGLTWAAGLGPPVFAPGFAEPRALMFDPRSTRLWLTGGDSRLGEGLTSLPLVEASTRTSPQHRAIDVPVSQGIVALVPFSAPDSVSAAEFLAINTDGKLLWMNAAGAPPYEWLHVVGEDAMELSAGPRGTVFVVTRSNTADEQSFSVLRLEAGALR